MVTAVVVVVMVAIETEVELEDGDDVDNENAQTTLVAAMLPPPVVWRRPKRLATVERFDFRDNSDMHKTEMSTMVTSREI